MGESVNQEPSVPAQRAASFIKTEGGGICPVRRIAAIIEEETAIGEIVAFLDELAGFCGYINGEQFHAMSCRAAELLDKAGVPR